MSGKYLGLIVRKDEIASKLMEAFSKGSQPDVLTLVCEAKLFDTVIQPTEKDGLDALNDVLASLSAPGTPPRPMAMGDFLITPTGQVKVVVGPGDFNDVTEKVAPLLGRYIPRRTSRRPSSPKTSTARTRTRTTGWRRPRTRSATAPAARQRRRSPRGCRPTSRWSLSPTRATSSAARCSRS
jgi:hypothetical protein